MNTPKFALRECWEVPASLLYWKKKAGSNLMPITYHGECLHRTSGKQNPGVFSRLDPISYLQQ